MLSGKYEITNLVWSSLSSQMSGFAVVQSPSTRSQTSMEILANGGSVCSSLMRSITLRDLSSLLILTLRLVCLLLVFAIDEIVKKPEKRRENISEFQLSEDVVGIQTSKNVHKIFLSFKCEIVLDGDAEIQTTKNT
jgi:hypothetical protein